MWHVYILSCADNTIYTGITTDLKRRLEEHNSSSLGAKYTRGRRPVVLLYSKKFKNKPGAAKEEWRIKKLGRERKMALVSKNKKSAATRG